MRRSITMSLGLATALSLSLPGCSRSGSESDPAATAPWRLDEAPAGAVDVAAAKTTAREGDAITIRGRIGGRMEPITAASGVFLLVDSSVPSCADMDEDHCPTPWDYCCEPKDRMTASTATVQVRDEAGNAVTLARNSLKPLQTVVVTGKVGPRPDPKALVVLASGVFVQPGK